jgi:pimeloyl-ACP methyl ester carboxylesterase
MTGRSIWLLMAWAVLQGAVGTADAQDSQVLRTVVAPAETLHVEIRGHGYPVVIVPGIWSSAFAFRKVVPDLVAGGLKVILIEPLGVASSSHPRHADYSLTAQARRVGAVLDSLGVHDAIFVGQALSTSMVLRLGTMEPLLIRGLVSLEGTADEVSATPGLRRGLAIGSWIFRIIPSQRLIRHQVKKNLENVSGDKAWITPEVVAEYTASFSVSISATFAAYRAMAASTESFAIRPRLRSLAFPVDLLLGMADHYGGPSAEEIAALQEHMAALTISRVPRSGHLLQEERPDQVVAAIFRMHRMIAAARD